MMRNDIIKPLDEYYKLLAIAIINQAISDYEIIGTNPKFQYICFMTINEVPLMRMKALKEFFRSDWCELLLTGTPYSGESILRKLEEKYKNCNKRVFCYNCIHSVVNCKNLCCKLKGRNVRPIGECDKGAIDE